MFNQQRFFGATITGFSASLGWGESPSQLVVGLVEDDYINDTFTPTQVGYPATFIFNDFSFTGIVQNYGAKADGGGFTFEATLSDPRDLLEGVQLILDGYTGSVSSYNLLNVYGYLESFGYGSSGKNESGIPWKNIRNTIHVLTSLGQQGFYGGPLRFLQSNYMVDLSSLPNIPDDYRVGADYISLLQFIGEICDAGGCEYFVSMVEVSVGIFVIKVNTVSRTTSIDYNAVTTFISSIGEFEQKSVGREFSNEVTSKFLVGGSVREMWYQYGDLSVNTIWPFWGFDINGAPIIGTGFGNNHTFTLDSRSVNNPRVGPYYQADVAEMRAVLGGRAGWETFLILKSGMGGIHSNKASSLGIIGYVANMGGIQLFNEILTNYNNSSTDPKQKKVELDLVKTFFPHTNQNQLDYEQLDIETGYLYNFLYQIATEYYGKKFMVNIPYVYSAIEPDTGRIRVSQFPVSSGFVEEALWPNAIQNNLLPIQVDRFTEEDGQIVCYVRYNNGDLLDLSELSQDAVAFSSANPQYGQHKLRNYSVFVKANVEEKVIYLDPTTNFGPRAIITVDGVVRDRVISTDFFGKQILIDFINGGFSENGVDINTPEYKTNVLDKIIGHIGQDVLNYAADSTAVIPDMAVIPLESEVRAYGPWEATGAAGRVEYEKDDTLVPWNYGGFDAMNLVAQSRVTSAIGLNQQLEQGEVTFPDVPFHNLGEPLTLGGPTVSDVSVSIDSGGAHTTYKFKRNIKQPRYGQAKAERVAQLARTSQRMRRNIRLSQLPKTSVNLALSHKPIVIDTKEHPKKKKTSSHEMLVGQTYTDNDDATTSSVFIQSDYNFIGHTNKDFHNKAFMSLDGLLTPFATYQHDNMPSFDLNDEGDFPNINDLNPYGSGDVNRTKIIARDYDLPQSLYGTSNNGEYRGLCLKGPMILSGWGYDTEDKPVPNLTPDDPSDEFLTEYREDQNTWPTGPVDFRWDNERKVWSAGGGTLLLEGEMKTVLSPGLTGDMNVFDKNGGISKVITVTDKAGWTVRVGAYVIVAKINGKYIPIVAEC